MKHHNPSFFRALFGGGRRTLRRPPLPLYVPLQARPDKEPPDNIEALWNRVTEHRPGPLLLLQELNRYLDRINPLPLPPEQRLRVGNILLGELGAAATALFARFLPQGGGIPETREQRDSISHAVRAAEQLGISYKLLFRRAWGGEPRADHGADEQLLTAALRVLECLRLEQLLRAFRYQKLPQYAWRDAHQLLFALRDGWPVTARLPLKVRFGIEDAGGRLELLPANASVEELYRSLALTGLLDVVSWPIPLMYRTSPYLDHLRAPPPILPDHGRALVAGQAVIYRDRGAPPSFERSRDPLGESLLIDLTPLLSQAGAERAARAAPAGMLDGETLRGLSPADRDDFLTLLVQHLQPQQRQDPRQPVFETHRARIYAGFEPVYRLFRDIGRNQIQETPLQESLQEQAVARAVPDTAALADSGWVVADEGPGGVQLRQREQAYSLPLFVGRLVAYHTGNHDIGDTCLGYLVRIQRLGDDEVEVAIARLQGRIRAVMANPLEAEEGRSLPVLLIQDHDGKSRLVCDNKHNFLCGERLAVLDGNHHFTAALGDVVLSRGDFTLFDLHTTEPRG